MTRTQPHKIKLGKALRDSHDSLDRSGTHTDEDIERVFYGRDFLKDCSGKDMIELIDYANHSSKAMIIDSEVIIALFDRVKKLEEIVGCLASSGWHELLAKYKSGNKLKETNE